MPRRVAISLLLGGWGVLRSASATPPVPVSLQSTLDTLLFYCMVTGTPVDRDELLAVWSRVNKPADPITPGNLTRWATQGNIPIVSADWSLAKIAERGGIALLFLREPAEMVLLLASGGDETLTMRGMEEQFASQIELKARYTGVCYVPKSVSESVHANPLLIEPALYTAKAATQAAPHRATLLLRNRGKETITVAVSSETCSCYGERPSLSESVIAPNKTAILTVPVLPRADKTESATVVLSTNVAAYPQAVVNVRVSPEQAVQMLPATVDVRAQEGVEWTGEITLKLPAKARITKMYARNDYLRLQSMPPVKEGDRMAVRIALRCPADRSPGDIADTLVFDLTGADVPQVIVPVTGVVLPDVFAEPAQLFLGEVRTGALISRTIALVSKSGKPFRVYSVTPGDPSITVTPFGSGSKARHEAQITVRVGEGDVYRQKITIRAGHWREIVYPITATITR